MLKIKIGNKLTYRKILFVQNKTEDAIFTLKMILRKINHVKWMQLIIRLVLSILEISYFVSYLQIQFII